MNNPLCRVLLVEDNEDDYLILRDLLADLAATKFDLEWANNCESARQLLAHHHYDVCFLDYRLGEATGMELVQEFAGGDTPFILLTGTEDYEVDVAATKAGVTDFLLKGHINAPLLERAIRYAIERKKTEMALLQAQRFAQATVDALPENIAVIDENGVIIAVNLAWRQFGAGNGFVGGEGGIGLDYLEICEGSGVEEGRIAAAGIRAMLTGTKEDFCFEYPCHTPTQQRWFQTCATRFRGAGALHVVIAHEEITERKKTEQQLQIHSELLNVVGQAVVVTDLSGRITYWNEFAEKLYGWSDSEVLGRNSLEITPSDATQQQAAEMMSCLAQGESWSGELMVQKRDGCKFPAYVTNTPVRDKAGQVVSIISLSIDITERKNAEKRLRESEANLAEAQRMAHLGNWEWDLAQSENWSRNSVHWSDETFRLFGYEPGQIEPSYENYRRMVHPDDLAIMETAAAQARRDRTIYAIDHPLMLPDGTRRIVHEQAKFIFDEAGQLLKMVGTVQDITESKLAEEALQKSAQEQRALAERLETEKARLVEAQAVGKVGSWETDIASLSVVWSDETHRIFETDPATFRPTHQKFLERVHCEDRAEVEQAFRASLDQRSTCTVEHRLRFPNDRLKFVEERWQVFFDDQGHPIRAAGTCQDITERRQADIFLRESEERFAGAFEQAPIGAALVLPNGQWLKVNEVLCALLGYGESELLSNTFQNITYAEDLDPDLENMRRLLAGEIQSYQIEKRYIHKHGHLITALLSVSLVRDSQGLPLYFISHIQDISERKRAEAALQQTRDELELRVEERTLELAQSNATLQLQIHERERAEREVRAQARQHESVAELGRQALLNIDLETLLHGAVVLIAATLELEGCSFWERLPDTSTLRMRVGVGLSEEIRKMPSPSQRQIGDQSQIGYAALLNEPVLSEDLENETRFSPTAYLLEKGVTSTITIPVQDGELYGVLAVSALQKLTQNEVFFLQTVANVLSSAIARRQAEEENLHLNTDLQDVNDELRANEIRLLQGAHVSAGLMRLRVRTHDELQKALSQITEAASSVLNVERSSVWLFNADESALVCLDLFESSKQGHSSGSILPADESYFPVIKTQSAIVANDVRTDPTLGCYWESYFKPNGISSVLKIALVVAGKHIGVLCSEHAGPPRQWQAEEQTGANSIASVCSLLLESYERARAETALQEAKEEAERATEAANAANQAKSEFLSRMSHELRTPLNAILGFGQILEMRSDDPKHLANVEQILKAGRHLLGLIDEVLDIARIEAGRLSLSLEPVSVGLLVREILEMVGPIAADQGIHLVNEVDSQQEEKHLLADQRRLHQVLLNLMSNAIKYNREGGSVFISCQIMAAAPLMSAGIQPEGRLRLRVRDTGAGLSEDEIGRLFVPFERLSAARSQIEGTGIGLTLCKRLVEAMDGSIGIESEVGQGSIFWIELPLISSPLEQATNLWLGPFNASSSPAGEFIGTILYIEDNLSNIDLIEQALMQRNYQANFLTAMQGSVGLELAAQHHPDLILLDMHLPDINGDVVLRHLKTNAATREIPVVVLSADATPSQIDRMLSAGAQEYLTKPLDMKRFFHVLEGIASGSS